MALLQHLIVFQLICVSVVLGFVSLQKMVLSSRHLRDVAFHMPSDSHEWVAIKPTLVAFYTPKCEREFTHKKVKETALPPTHIVTYLKHDYQTYPPLVWYDLDEDENSLTDIFKVKKCPTMVYIAEGDTMEKYQTWTGVSEPAFDKWLWKLLAVDVFIGTRHEKSLQVSFQGPTGASKLDTVILKTGGMKTIKAYVGYKMFVIVSHTKRVLYSTFIDFDTAKEKIVIDSETKTLSNDLKEWKGVVSKKDKDLEHQTTDREFSILYMYVRTFKQPLLLGYFTQEGHTVMTLNDHMYEELITFWDHHFWEQKHSKYILNASQYDYYPWVEMEDNPVKTLKLSTSLKGNVTKVVKEMAEQWLETELEVVNVRGIHHFREGHFMKMHVSEADDVITAWIILEKEKHDSHHYFEVINYQTGQEEIVDFIPGEVFIFESSTLILSMHEPLKAEQFFTIVSLSFKPKEYWPWKLNEHGSAIEVEDVMGTRLEERLDHIEKNIITNSMPKKIDYDHTIFRPVTKEAEISVEEEVQEEEVDLIIESEVIETVQVEEKREIKVEPEKKKNVQKNIKPTRHDEL